MARRRNNRNNHRRGRGGIKIPIAVVMGAVPTAQGIWERKGDLAEVGRFLKAGYTGIGSDGTFNLVNFRLGLFPLAGGIIIHKLASRFGVNRMLGSMGIPVIRI